MLNTSHLLKAALAASLIAASGAACAAVSRTLPESANLSDLATVNATGAQCESSSLDEAVTLLFQQNDVPAAAGIAKRCEALSIAQQRPFYKTIASRIKAMIAMKAKDMHALQLAGEALVAEAHFPEYVADGHMFIAFACVFSGNAGCARTHLEQAKAMFAQHEVLSALEQLRPVEQALNKLEGQDQP